MFFRARRALSRAWFDFNCRAILRTPPVAGGDGDVALVSMVCHGEVLMYLLAVKSFCRQLGRGVRIVVLDDGSLSMEDLATIGFHLHGVEIVSISSIDTDGCPKGSCWERLLLISQLAEQSFVIQLDCDTLAINPIEEVAECIDTARSFTLLGDRSYPFIEPMKDACSRLKANPSAQVQAICERTFDLVPESAELKYLRGNAGFTGFAKGSIDRDRVQWFSDLMRGLAASKWDEWGSEQVTSNLLIANADRAYPLPAPKYLSYWAHADVDYDRAAFLHLIGPHRYANGFYLQRAKQVISTLR